MHVEDWIVEEAKRMRIRAEAQTVLPGCGMTLDEMVADSIELLRLCEPDEGYYGCFSGGKDSVVIKELARQAGVGVEWHYNVTTIDPPELVRFIRREHPDVTRERPKQNFFRAIIKRGFPTRIARWCCDEYKESRPPKGAVLLMGIRAAESPRRAKQWTEVADHRRTGTYCILPILRWPDEHVWAFIRREGLPYCSLYDEGFERLGCIGCPMAGRAGKLREFARWPGYEKQWRRAFRLLWDRRAGTPQHDNREWWGSALFSDWEQMWDWWVNDDPLPGADPETCQLDFWT